MPTESSKRVASAIEKELELIPAQDAGPNVFVNTSPSWHAPGATGVYGGTVMAQSIAAAYKTVPTEFDIHSLSCYFLVRGNISLPIFYHVETVRQGQRFATRNVHARQSGRTIFTTMLSFMKPPSGTDERVEHSAPLSGDILRPPISDGEVVAPILTQTNEAVEAYLVEPGSGLSQEPYLQKHHIWIRARDRISVEAGDPSHLAALAYISDRFLFGTLSKVYRLYRFSPPPGSSENGSGISIRTAIYGNNDVEFKDAAGITTRPTITLMLSLDQSMYFHNPAAFRADDWLLAEMETPWAGETRALVVQRIFTSSGVLVATCIQEGLMRISSSL